MTNEQNHKDGKIIVIVAPSGTGKSTLIQKLRRELDQLEESVSYTTRSQREGEVHGEHYFFVDEETFKRMREEGEFLEWAMVHGDHKGTSIQQVKKKLEEGVDLLFDLDIQGADAIKRYFGDKAKIIFIEPPSLDELEKRLRGRKTESEEKIQVRLENAKRELDRRDDYDYCVTNDTFDRAYGELKTIVKGILED